MRFSPVQLDYFKLEGGLDLVTPPFSIAPGFCREAQNYEIGVNGGYKRCDGYSRFDGQPAPNDAVYYVIPATITGTIAVGDTVTGLVSGATGEVIAVEAAAVIITKLTNTFNGSEALQVSAVTQATMTSSQVISGASTNDLHWLYLSLAADVYRADILAVPGSGNILGVWYYDGTVYAFRNNAGGTESVMYKSSGSGWTLVTTATLNPGGRYQFVNYNFGSGLMMYGCDGANKAFQFDGTTYTELTTGMATDTPDLIAAHVNHLFLAFDNSLQHSAIGNPASWTPVLGAGELNIGETLTNLLPQPGDANGAAMAVYARNGTFMLYGTSSSNWKLVTVTPDAGAFAYTAQYLGTGLVFDDRGVTALETSQKFGNFEWASMSKLIRPYVIENKARVIASGVSKDKNQYRVFFNNGRALYYTLQGGFMPLLFPDSLTCYTSSEDADGDEVAYAGDSAGYVYQMDVGNSFDGDDIESYAALVFNNIKSPRTLKFFRKAVVEVSGEGAANFWLSADLAYSSTDIESVPLTQLTADLSAGQWDTGVWDTGFWDGRILAPAEFELTGTAENIAIRVAQISDYQPPLTFYGILMHYTPRRLLR